jgi:hypothetical protein
VAPGHPLLKRKVPAGCPDRFYMLPGPVIFYAEKKEKQTKKKKLGPDEP